MSDLLIRVILSNSPTQIFFDSLKLSTSLEAARFIDVRRAYIAYHIWLSRNSWVFESIRLSDYFILKLALIQVTEFI